MYTGIFQGELPGRRIVRGNVWDCDCRGKCLGEMSASAGDFSWEDVQWGNVCGEIFRGNVQFKTEIYSLIEAEA